MAEGAVYDWEKDAVGCYELCIAEMKKRHAETGEIPPAMLGTGRHTTHLLLENRGRTHGDFSENARIAQFLRAFFRTCPGWDRLTDVEREAFDMDAIKAARLLSGGADRLDSWRDRAGYAELAARYVDRLNADSAASD